MTQADLLTNETVAFLMEAILAGRIAPQHACSLITPWVEGLLPSEPLAEDGAQLIHGFDVIVKEGGTHSHASTDGVGWPFLLTEEKISKRCRRWLARAGQ